MASTAQPSSGSPPLQGPPGGHSHAPPQPSMTARHCGKAAGCTGAALSSGKAVEAGSSPEPSRQKKRHCGGAAAGDGCTAGRGPTRSRLAPWVCCGASASAAWLRPSPARPPGAHLDVGAGGHGGRVLRRQRRGARRQRGVAQQARLLRALRGGAHLLAAQAQGRCQAGGAQPTGANTAARAGALSHHAPAAITRARPRTWYASCGRTSAISASVGWLK